MILASELSLLFLAPIFVASTFGLAHNHRAEILSLEEIIAVRFYSRDWVVGTKECRAAERNPARRMERRELERCRGSKGDRLESVFGGACTNGIAELGAKVSQKGLCAIYLVFHGALGSLYVRGDRSLKTHHHFGARNSDLSHEKVTKGATRDCSGSFTTFRKAKTAL